MSIRLTYYNFCHWKILLFTYVFGVCGAAYLQNVLQWKTGDAPKEIGFLKQKSKQGKNEEAAPAGQTTPKMPFYFMFTLGSSVCVCCVIPF